MSRSVSIRLPCWFDFMIAAKAVEAAAITSAPTCDIPGADFSLAGAAGAEDVGMFIGPEADGWEQTRLFESTVGSDGRSSESSSSIGFMGTRGVRLSS